MAAAEFTFTNGHLAMAGRDLTAFPTATLAALSGGAAAVTSVDLSYNALATLDALALFPSLKSAVLDYNALRDQSAALPDAPHLHTLCVNANEIADIKAWCDALQRYPSLTYLSMLKNPACPNFFTGRDADDYQRYRYYVLHRLPQLRFLDSTAVSDDERREAARIGHLQLPARPDASQQEKLDAEQSARAAASAAEQAAQPQPLPQDTAQPAAGQTSFGRTQYIYSGRQSEGNRFIRNDDL